MKRTLANFPLKVSMTIFALFIFSVTFASAQLINVTGNNVELTQVSADCNSENEVGIAVTGTGFTGWHLSSQNCVAGAFSFSEDATLTNSLGISVGDDITIAVGKTITGTYNLFGDAVKAGLGTYSDGGNTTLWGAVYSDRVDEGTHTGNPAANSGYSQMTDGYADINGNNHWFKCDYSKSFIPDIGAEETECYSQDIPDLPLEDPNWVNAP